MQGRAERTEAMVVTLEADERAAGVPPPRGRRLGELTPRQRRWAIVLALLVTAPFVVAAFQAAHDDWYPIGDNGTMLTVTRQVFTTDTPLTGEVASGTRYGAHPFHPGPMVYYLLAPFQAAFGGVWGMLLGAAFVSVGAVALVGYAALRTAGPAAATWAWLTTLAMCWSLGGTAFLYPPFKTTLSLLVIMAFLHLCAALLAGRSSLLPWWVLAASFPMAATMRYLIPVAAVAVCTLGALLILRWRRTARGAPDAGWRHHLATSLRPTPEEGRSLVIAGVLLVVCWWAPLYDAVTNRGGNVRELYRASRTASQEVDGLAQAIGEQAKALLLNPVQSAGDFHTSSGLYIALSVTLLGVFAVLAVRLRHRLSRAVWANVAVAGFALAAMLATLATTPSDEGFGVYRTLASAPVALFVLFAGGLLVGCAVAPRLAGRGRSFLPVTAVALVVATLAVAVPGPIDAETEQYPFAFAATRQLVDEAAPRLETDGRWSTWVIGGRTTPTIFVGFKAGLEANGLDTGVDAGAPGFGAEDGRDPKPSAGTIVLTASELPAPEGAWEAVATYEPQGRTAEDARAVADELVEFAAATNPRPLDAFTGTVPRIMCPELASSGFEGPCPEADEILAADNPVAALPPAAVALVYLVQFGDDTQFPVIDGPRPPDELLDAAGALWDDLPLTVYALRADGG